MDKIDEIKLRTLQLASAYKVSNLQDFIDKSYRIANKEYIEDILIKINNQEKENYIFVVDSNLNINHAIDSSGFIEAKLKKEKLEKEVEVIFIPLNIGYNSSSNYIKEKMVEKKENKVLTIEELNKKLQESIDPNRVIELIADKFKDKNVAINESFVVSIYLDKIYTNKITKFDFNDLNSQELKNKINSINQANDEKIKLLEANPNIKLYKSAGNYVHNSSNINDRDKLKDILISLDGKYETIESMSTLMVILIEAKLSGLNISELEKELEDLFEEPILKKHNKDEFIDLFIKDYLANYESYDLLKKIEQRGIDNIKIVEAINSKSIIENYERYKKILLTECNKQSIACEKKGFEIKELEDLSSNLSYKLEDTEYILELYNKYKEEYPFIFKMNNLGSFINFINHNTLGYKVGVDGQDGTTMFRSNTGTSSASPMILVNDYTQEIKQKKLELQNIQEEDNSMNFNR